MKEEEEFIKQKNKYLVIMYYQLKKSIKRLKTHDYRNIYKDFLKTISLTKDKEKLKEIQDVYELII